ncbi:hypothetical protein BD410DRAFT_900749 [Rickenella mellea]|uniref:ER transporter 6TM N-terminal domain-containing protein n=1 Tax=Rickenella mellea TaxID=50990 RepID=A0A4Y7PVR9_9AGAM|nr:hypothetical protein BD410DRAFT_900749 [Rickenella mellea]
MSDNEKTVPSQADRSPTSTSKDGEQKPARDGKFLDTLPPWIATNLRSKKSWKILARCWLASWLSFLIILPNRPLKAMGNAAFFALMSSFLVPPNMPVQMFVFAISTMIVGMCFGWAIGAAAMKAALSARNQKVLKQTILSVQESAAGAVNPDAQFKLSIFQGAFLDVSSSAVFGVFLGVAVFFFACVRAYAPKLALFAVFGTVVVDIFCAYGPLFPVAQYTIVSSLIISVAVYIAIGIVLILTVFPETMNHAYLASVSAALGNLKSFVELQADIVSTSPGELSVDPNGSLAKMAGLKAAVLAGLQGLEAKSSLINAEFSWGRWNGDDAKDLVEPLKFTASRASGFQSFTRHIIDAEKLSVSRETTKSSDSSPPTQASSQPIDHMGETELIRQLHAHHHRYELQHNTRLSDIMPILERSTADLHRACVEGLAAAQNAIDEINHGRWTRRTPAIADRMSEAEARLDRAIESLRTAVTEFREKKRLEIVAPFIPAVNALKTSTKPLPLRSLVIAYVYCSALVVTSDGVITLLEMISQTAKKRKRSRLWAPSGLRAIGKFILRKGDHGDTEELLGDTRPDNEVEKEEEEKYQRDPDSRPPTNFIQRIADANHRVYQWFKSPEGLFVVKNVVVTIALWLPSVIRSSAYFAYVNKSVWAIIMAQTTLGVYVSDQIFSYVTRLGGTFLGLALGTLGWYVGNGRGNGNGYASAAAFGVLILPIVFVRAFAPPVVVLPVLMFGVTIALIMGYSWIDSHLVVYGSPGIGWHVAWRRFVLVIIGCVASFILMMFPPTSGRKAVRLRNASVVTELGSLYAYLISAWISVEHSAPENDKIDKVTGHDTNGDDAKARGEHGEVEKRGKSWPPQRPKWAQEFRSRIIDLSLQVQTLRGQTALARWEGSVRGVWPKEEYDNLVQTESDMISALAQFAGALIYTDPAWRLRLKKRTKLLNPKFITEVMSLFALVSQALRTGEALHQVLPTALLDSLIYHQQHHRQQYPLGSSTNGNAGGTEQNGDDHGQEDDDVDEEAGVDTLDPAEEIQSEDYMYHAVGVAAVTQILSGLDDLHRTTKRLCGEVPFKGFEDWRNDYEREYSHV